MFLTKFDNFGQISDLYFLTIFGGKSKKTAVKSDQKFFSKNPVTQRFQKWRSDCRNFCRPPNFGDHKFRS